MHNKTQYKLYIITEGICLNYKGVPLLFSRNQIERVINKLCDEWPQPPEIFFIRSQISASTRKVVERPPKYWYHFFIDNTYTTLLGGETIPANATALKTLGIPLRQYQKYEFYIEATRKPYRQAIKSFWRLWTCPKCRYGLSTGNCYCQNKSQPGWGWQNDYYDFKSMILNHF